MRIIFIFFFAFCVFEAFASHIIGGDIYYDDLGGGNYRFFITLYRDCNSDGAQYDDPLKLSVYRQNQDLYQTVDVSFPGSNFVPTDFNNPCATPPSGICVERAVYQKVLNLPPTVGGYWITYQRCCRGPDIVNIINPDDTGLTLTTHIPGSETGISNNSSPRFSNYPPYLICNNDELIFDHSATDPDGDVLVYSLATPFSGADSFNPAPEIAPPPPYFPIQWTAGFTAQAPLGPNAITQLNNAGTLTVNPNLIGLFVVGVRVEEYRNGILIGETIRDFLFKVFDCNISMQALLPLQEELSTFVSYCQGLTVQFENNSFGGSSYAWDFGVTDQATDVSNTFTPTYTYPAPGDYLTTLIVNPGMECTDTAFMNITVGNPFAVAWTAEDSICILNNSFEFNVVTSNQNANFEWTFDGDATILNWSGLDVPSISFSSPGFHTVALFADDGDCATIFEDSIYIFDEPIVDIVIPDDIACNGLTVTFESSLSDVSNTLWDFGVENTTTDQSSLFNPTFIFEDPGSYTVQLIGSNAPGCADTSWVNIDLNEPIVLSFTHSDSLCITDGLFAFDAEVSGPEGTVYLWDFGSNASIQNTNELAVSGIQFSTSGFQEIQLSAANETCSDSIQAELYVFSEPIIDFDVFDNELCAPSVAQFINQSQVEGQVVYQWDFGDGLTSNDFNPFHTYTSIGSFSVGLTLMALEGCTDTLYLLSQDAISINPSPVAAFSVNPDRIDVCDNEVSFINEAVGAISFIYLYDSGQFSTTEADFDHSYTQGGSDYPMQIVFNEYGCSDSVRNEVFVEPFTIYIPNTFIPDGDGVNDSFVPITDFDIYEWEFSVFNRWGNLIFVNTDVGSSWDGYVDGEKVEDGTYIYTLKYKSCANPIETKMIQGFVNVLR
jgi:gliding motility-associated-like protein